MEYVSFFWSSASCSLHLLAATTTQINDSITDGVTWLEWPSNNQMVRGPVVLRTQIPALRWAFLNTTRRAWARGHSIPPMPITKMSRPASTTYLTRLPTRQRIQIIPGSTGTWEESTPTRPVLASMAIARSLGAYCHCRSAVLSTGLRTSRLRRWRWTGSVPPRSRPGMGMARGVIGRVTRPAISRPWDGRPWGLGALEAWGA